MSLRNSIHTAVILSVLCLWSCANQTSPTGGPRDEDPPRLINSTPADKSLNFNRQKIELEFDEYLKLQNPKDEIIITPRISGDYEIKLKKTKVTLQLEDSLESNTTYTFNFRESIQDLNEGNVPENLQIAFSTGDYLDSLTISGSTHYLLNNKKASDITIALYHSDDTLNILNSSPVYLTKSDEFGAFIFDNLKDGKYDIYAFRDKNKNLLLESKSESYSYFDKPILLDSNISDITLPLINLDLTPLQLQNDRVSGHYYVAKYNKYVQKYEIKLLDSADTTNPIITKLSDDHQEIKFYNSNQIADSLGLIITAYDTLLDYNIDTVYVRFGESKRNKDPFNITYSKIVLDKMNPTIQTELTFSKPNQHINFDSIYYQVDSALLIHPDSTHFKWNYNHTQLNFVLPLDSSIFKKPNIQHQTDTSANTPPIGQSIDNKELSKNKAQSRKSPAKNKSLEDKQMHFKTGAFISVESDTSVIHSEKYTLLNKSDQAILILDIQTNQPSFILQLLNNKGVLVLERQNEKSLKLEDIQPGTYSIRILVDKNQNGIWDLGNFQERTLPEPVIFYKNEEDIEDIKLKANWVLGPLQIKF